ncbi:MAG: hypothetical protein Fur004_06310 [Thermoflexibacter sp.]
MTEKKNINWRKQLFNWHLWLGLFFTLPIVLVAITAILIAHEKGLGTKEIAVKAGWLPAYSSNEKNLAYYLDDVKDIQIVQGKTLYGTKLGVVEENNDQLSIIKGTEGKEVRDLLWVENQLWVATKKGLLLAENETAKLVKKGDFHGITFDGTTLIASEGKKGFHLSQDQGRTWETKKISTQIGTSKLQTFANQVDKEIFMEALTLEKLVLDIHTGKAFFGEGSMWVWIDLIAVSLLGMIFTGILMWYKRKFSKKAPTKANQAPAKKIKFKLQKL